MNGSVEKEGATAKGGGAPHLSLIIPAYNEEQRLQESLPAVLEYLERQPYTWELIVVDDGSRDRTAEVVQKLAAGRPNVRVLRNEPNRGKGYSIRRGMLEAQGAYRLFSDADFSTPISEVEKYWKVIDEGYDVVIGSRGLAESELVVRQNPLRESMGRVFNFLVQMLLIPGIRDTQCGFKMFSARAAQSVFPRQTLDGFSFDVEILYLAMQSGFRVKEVPIRWFNSPATKVSPLRDSAKMFVDLLKLRFRGRGRQPGR
jgi:dolichyl-phosphate beta-glucosyltransferase